LASAWFSLLSSWYYQFDKGGIEMSDEFNKVVISAVKNQEQAVGLVEKLFAVAQPGAVYSEPVTVGEHTVITASEVSVAMGFGYGMGGGPGQAGRRRRGSEDEPQDERGEAGGMGGGGGGGGASSGRPVAVISIRPEGVRVEPVVDPTKIALAFFTTIGSMLIMLSKMRKASKLT
jgi:uncharacterized spore protein YtfJ